VRPGGTVATGGHTGVLANLHTAETGVALAANHTQATQVLLSQLTQKMQFQPWWQDIPLNNHNEQHHTKQRWWRSPNHLNN